MRSGIEPLKKFARNRKAKGQASRHHGPLPPALHTSLLESINDKINVLKRAAYGFRDDHYFFLRISTAFPGIPCSFKILATPKPVKAGPGSAAACRFDILEGSNG